MEECIINRAGRVGVIEQVTLEQRCEGVEGEPCNYLGKECPRQRTSQHKGPEVGAGLA